MDLLYLFHSSIFSFYRLVKHIFQLSLIFLLLYLDFTQKEYLIGARDNPSVSIPIGAKEILNYQSTIASLNREIQNYEVSKAVCAALGLEAQVPVLEENIKSAQEYKAKLEDMLNKAVQ